MAVDTPLLRLLQAAVPNNIPTQVIIAARFRGTDGVNRERPLCQRD